MGIATVKSELLEVVRELVKGQTDEFCIHSDGQDGVHCSGCLPPAVSRGAGCRCNEPSSV